VLSEENRPASGMGQPLLKEQLERKIHDAGAREIAGKTGRTERRTNSLNRETSEANQRKRSIGESERGKVTGIAGERGKSEGQEERESPRKHGVYQSLGQPDSPDANEHKAR
jgi:hypothetical protein